jgi:carbamoyltransferase
MANNKKWENLFGFPKRDSESELEQKHCNLGYAIQQITEEVVLKLALEAKRLTGSDNLCMAGGVALNCVSNGKLHDRKDLFKEVFITPASGDAGGALGAALAAHHIYYGNKREPSSLVLDNLKGSYLGPDISPQEIEKVIRKFGAVATPFEDFDELCEVTAGILEKGKVVGWVQGRMEFGPRALGNRSILGDPRNEEMQKKLNLKIKYRESFRPFAPSVLAEDAASYFKLDGISPYMLLVKPVSDQIKKVLPANYDSLGLKEKLYTLRSDLPAITHIDFSARIQTVHKETNLAYWRLINAFKKKTGCSAVVNTSFNVRGEPIVCSAEDAYRCFMRTEMDYLVIGSFLFSKKDQPEWVSSDDWKEEFILD